MAKEFKRTDFKGLVRVYTCTLFYRPLDDMVIVPSKTPAYDRLIESSRRLDQQVCHLNSIL